MIGWQSLAPGDEVIARNPDHPEYLSLRAHVLRVNTERPFFVRVEFAGFWKVSARRNIRAKRFDLPPEYVFDKIGGSQP